MKTAWPSSIAQQSKSEDYHEKATDKEITFEENRLTTLYHV